MFDANKRTLLREIFKRHAYIFFFFFLIERNGKSGETRNYYIISLSIPREKRITLIKL